MFNVFKKTNHQKKYSQWNEILKTRILPESNIYASEAASFNENYAVEEINQTMMPDSTVILYFTTGLYLIYAEYHKEISSAYLKVALQIANTILELPKSETQR